MMFYSKKEVDLPQFEIPNTKLYSEYGSLVGDPEYTDLEPVECYHLIWRDKDDFVFSIYMTPDTLDCDDKVGEVKKAAVGAFLRAKETKE